MRRYWLTFVFVLCSVAVLYAAEPSSWTIDPVHSYVGFSVRHMMVSNVRGSFDKFSGTIVGDPADPTNAKIDVTIDTTSLNTKNGNRDEHLKSADFFDVAKYPTMTFKSKRITKAADGTLRVVGDFALHGVIKEVILVIDGPTPPIQAGPATRIGASARTKVNRKDFGLNWNRVMEAGGVAVGDEVQIDIELELIKNQPEAPKPSS